LFALYGKPVTLQYRFENCQTRVVRRAESQGQTNAQGANESRGHCPGAVQNLGCFNPSSHIRFGFMQFPTGRFRTIMTQVNPLSSCRAQFWPDPAPGEK
jgi:hypothetical protein